MLRDYSSRVRSSCNYNGRRADAFLLSLIYQWIIFFQQLFNSNGKMEIHLINLSMSAGSRRVKMGMLKEFREFAMRGNVVDLAVGVIIGAAFGKNCIVFSGRYYYASAGFCSLAGSTLNSSPLRYAMRRGCPSRCHALWCVYSERLRFHHRCLRDFSWRSN